MKVALRRRALTERTAKMKSRFSKWWPALPAIAASAAALAACQTPPPPTAQMNRAQTAILGAQQDGAQQIAPAQLQTAQSKLSAAQAAVAQKDMEQAKYLAEESEMDAIYANQLALTQKAENVETVVQRNQPNLEKGMRQR
jgi:membrane-bound lytic murein transglycosylase